LGAVGRGWRRARRTNRAAYGGAVPVERLDGPSDLGVFAVDVPGEVDRPVVAVAGELDLGTAGQLRAALLGLPAHVRAVQLDLSQVSFIDSTALGVLLAAYKRLQVLGAGLEVSAASPVVATVLEISGLSALLGAGKAIAP
jgi:anti-sigma B factor antagonist